MLDWRRRYRVPRSIKALLRLAGSSTPDGAPDLEQQLGAATKPSDTDEQIKQPAERLQLLEDQLSKSKAQIAKVQQDRAHLAAALEAKIQQVAKVQQDRAHLAAALEAKIQQVATRDQHIAHLQVKHEVVCAGALASASKTPLVLNRARKLVILDDAFPHLLSAFRIAEFNAYLDAWRDTVVFSTASSFYLLRETRQFTDVLRDYESKYPQFTGRVSIFDPSSDLEGSLVYMMFLNNASYFLDVVHAYDVPFVFTLYPGGGLQLWQAESDEKLRRVCSSPNLHKVIATQEVVREYLLEKRFCDPQKIEFIYGGVYPATVLAASGIRKSFYRYDRDTFDVCFVAHKYMARGTDKGYDVFIEAAELISRAHEDASFHVVGPFDETDVNLRGLEGRISFYGTRPTEFFPSFYAGMDAIISPNAAFVLASGAINIFPLGSCIEAGSCGVAVFCTDPLNQNVAFEDGKEIVIVPRDAEAISQTVGWYHDRPEALRHLSERGRDAFRRVFAMEAQMKPRLRILSELMGEQVSSRDTDSKRGQDGNITAYTSR